MDDKRPVGRTSADEGLSRPASDGLPDLEECEFFRLPGLNVLSVAALVALTAFAIFMVIRAPAAADTALQVVIARVAFGIVAMFGAVSTVRAFARAGNDRFSLRFDRDGITDRTGVGPPTFVPWDEIVSLEPGARSAALEIKLRNPSSVKLTGLRRFTTWILRRTRDTDLVIPCGGLAVPSKTIVALAREWTESRLLNEVRTSEMRTRVGEDIQELRARSDQKDSEVT